MTLAKTILAAVAALAIASPALAADKDAGAAPFQTDALYKAFHGKPGIDRVVDTLLVLSAADPRISDIFKGQDIPHLRQMLDEQFCYLLAGPCTYTGKDMKEGHKDLGIQETDFNAMVENLQKAMDKEGVPFRDQNRFLAKLAPMERVVVQRSGAPKLLQR